MRNGAVPGSAAMPRSSRTVQIPLAGDGDRPGRIALVQADGTPPDQNAPLLKPQIADLHDAGLYQAGRAALTAVRQLGLRARGFAPAQWLRPGRLASYLAVVNPTNVLGLSPENSSSAELGLALGLVMHAGQSRERIVIASGALSREERPEQVAPGDVAILPVGRVGRKIAAVLASLETQRGAAFGPRVLFFLPAETLTGQQTLQAHSNELTQLAQAFRRRGIELEVVPVSSLLEAVAKLGVASLASTPADRWLVRIVAAAAAGFALLWLGRLWLEAPLDLAFEAVELSDGRTAPSPVRAAYDQQTSAFVIRPPCRDPQNLPVYRAGEFLVLKAAVRNGRALDSLLGGYYYAVLGVAERSGIKVFPPETLAIPATGTGPSGKVLARPSAGRSELGLVLPVGGPTEKNKLIILARRLRPFDARGLRAELETVLSGKGASDRINVAVTHLAGSAPGYLDYSFSSAEEEPRCEPKS